MKKNETIIEFKIIPVSDNPLISTVKIKYHIKKRMLFGLFNYSYWEQDKWTACSRAAALKRVISYWPDANEIY